LLQTLLTEVERLDLYFGAMNLWWLFVGQH
jgi:hypothetical protein